MQEIIEKPYSFSLSICFLVLGILVVSETEMYISGVAFILASLLIFTSFVQSKVKQFTLGQAFIYIGAGVFYMDIVSKLVFGINVLFILSFIMLHLTLKFIVTSEYERS